jgi:hypothetical protein
METWMNIPYEELSCPYLVDEEAYTDKRTDLFRPAFKMLNPIGGLGVCCTIAEKENNISKPWL